MLLASCHVKEKLAAGQQWLIVRESFIHSAVMVQFAKTPQNSLGSILTTVQFLIRGVKFAFSSKLDCMLDFMV